jgi:inner membrane transporter RhtA
VQVGAAAATTLFDEAGPGGAVFLRIALAALALVALWRPTLRGVGAAAARDALLFGVTLAAMNWSFYEAIDRIPLGIAVTIEFVGPLAVAFGRSHRRLVWLWAGLAAAGLLLLAPLHDASVDTVGAGFALLAGLFWGAYILLSVRVGRAFPGGAGLAIAMAVAAALMIPVGVIEAGAQLLSAHVLAVALAVALLSSAIPYSLELEALRRIPEATFGVLMSLEPAVAALVGFVALGQGLSVREVIAIGFVLIASAGALSSAGDRSVPPP